MLCPDLFAETISLMQTPVFPWESGILVHPRQRCLRDQFPVNPGRWVSTCCHSLMLQELFVLRDSPGDDSGYFLLVPQTPPQCAFPLLVLLRVLCCLKSSSWARPCPESRDCHSKYLPPRWVVSGTLTQSCFHSLRADHTVWIRDSYRAEQIIHCDLPILPEGLSKPRRWKRMGGKVAPDEKAKIMF